MPAILFLLAGWDTTTLPVAIGRTKAPSALSDPTQAPEITLAGTFEDLASDAAFVDDTMRRNLFPFDSYLLLRGN